MADHPEKGQLDARTPPPVVEPDGRDAEEQHILSLLQGIDTTPQLPGLADEQPDTFDLLGRAAENLNAKRRARGRPVNSANRRNDETFDYLEARGFKAPELRKMELISADPFELAQAIVAATWSGEKPPKPTPGLVLEIMKMQDKSATDLLPFKFAKKQELNVNHQGNVAHVMVAGPLSNPEDRRTEAFSLTGETVEYQEVSAETPGQSQDGQSQT